MGSRRRSPLSLRKKTMRSKDQFDLKSYLSGKKAIVDRALETYMPEPEGPASDLIKAMKYSLFAGGKRLRPILCLAGTEAVGGTETDCLAVACALELIHTSFTMTSR